MSQVRSQVRVYGVDIPEVYARKLVGGLIKAGSPPAVEAAKRIAGGISRHDSAGPLTPEMRDAILAALRKPPPPGTQALYRALVRDQVARREITNNVD